MSNHPVLPTFVDKNTGQTTREGQVNAGNWERTNFPNAPQAAQQPYESYDAYLTRINGS